MNSFIPPEAGGLRRQRANLANILYEAAAFGMVLFAQPGSWIFRWEAKQGARRTGSISRRREQEIVVFPGIAEERTGRQPPRVLMEPDIQEL